MMDTIRLLPVISTVQVVNMVTNYCNEDGTPTE